MSFSYNAAIWFRWFDLAVFLFNELWSVDSFSTTVDCVDFLSKLGTFWESKDVIPMNRKSFCRIVLPYLSFSAIKIFPQPDTNYLFPFIIKPSFVLEFSIFDPPLILVFSTDFLKSLFLNYLWDLFSGLTFLFVLFKHETVKFCSDRNWGQNS